MAIAFDAKSTGTRGSAEASPLTFAHTCSGNDRVLYVSVLVKTLSGYGATNFSVTYAGASMTPLDTIEYGSYGKIYTFYLVAPATGANNVVVSYTIGIAYEFTVQAISLTGVDQTNPVDVHGTNTFPSSRPFVTNLTTNYTTLICYSMYKSASYGLTAYNGTLTYTYDDSRYSFYWGAGAAGAKTLSVNWSTTDGTAMLAYIAFREAAPAGTSKFFQLF